MQPKVMACIDASIYSPAVCDYAAWSALRLAVPLAFIHVLDKARDTGSVDLSGSIGLGAQESLLEELASLDEQRGKLARERGRLMLEATRQRASEAGVAEPEGLLRHGELVETLAELEEGVRLLVLGKRGETAAVASQHLGSNLERVIRATHRPILVTTDKFRVPQRIMLAFDGSATTRKGVEMVATSPMFRGLPCHLVMAGAKTAATVEQLAQARQRLEKAGFETPATILPGGAENVLTRYQQENQIDLMIMGAYGHSRIRQLLVGSTTTAMIRESTVPLLLLR